MNAKNIIAACLLGILILASTEKSKADEASAIASVNSYEGQVLGIAKDVEGVRILIPAKTFEGRILADADLAVLKEIPKVIELDLKNASIGDAGAAHLSALTDLQRLHLEKTKITDAGLAHLKDLTGLEYLNLYGTEVTDAGLEHLKGLTSLKQLYLWQTKVSEDAAKSFQASMESSGNDSLEINLGWEKELLSKARITFLKGQKARLETSEEEKSNELKLASKDIQKLCPLMVDEEVDGEEIVQYKGINIEFCCGSCVKKFKKDPDYYVKLCKGLLPQIPEELISNEVNLIDQKFCLVNSDKVVTPKSYKYNHNGKDFYFWNSSAVRTFSKKPEYYIARYREQKAELAKKLNLDWKKELISKVRKPAAEASASEESSKLTSTSVESQKLCPLMLDEEVDGEEIVQYKGINIEFCCGSCVKKFKKDPDYYVRLTKGLLPQIPEKLVSNDIELMEQKFCLVYNDRIVTPKSYKHTHNGKDFYFWSNSAIRTFSQKPEYYIARYQEQKAELAKKLNLGWEEEFNNKKQTAIATLPTTQASETSKEASQEDRVAKLEAENQELRKKLKELVENK